MSDPSDEVPEGVDLQDLEPPQDGIELTTLHPLQGVELKTLSGGIDIDNEEAENKRDCLTEAEMATNTTTIITKANPITPFKGNARVGEYDFTPGPDYDTWMSSVLTYCASNKITDSKAIVDVAKVNIDQRSGDAYAALYTYPLVLAEDGSDHIRWFKAFRFRFDKDSDQDSKMMMMFISLFTLKRETGERWDEFIQRVGLLESKMRAAQPYFPVVKNEFITLMVEAAIMGSCPQQY